VVIVAHFYPLLVIVLSALNIPLSKVMRLGQDRGAINTLEFEGGGVKLIRLNDTCHLEGI
jgi:broad specificity phosphatase PhoE